MKKFIPLLILAAAALVSCSGNKSKLSGEIQMGGSTTVEPIIRTAIEAYSKIEPGVKLNYEAQGSSVGIKGILEGIYVFGGSSRDIKKTEEESGAYGIPIALDGLAVIVNKGVPVDNLDRKTVAAIFTGEINNWKQLGGPDRKIVVVNRDEASGTRGAFLEIVLQSEKGKDAKFIADAITTESNGDLVTKVGTTPDSIGYCGMGYLPQAKSFGAKPLSINNVEAAEENVVNGSYSISRKLYLVHKGPVAENTPEKSFLDFLLSKEGQRIVEEEGFISVK
jgi:phosphate transport system substrate-binding protein